MKNPVLEIALTYKDSRLYEINTDDFYTDIYIGRSSKATWKVPAEESSVSSRHAVIRQHHGSFVLEDLESHNGTFCGGKKIKHVKLEPGVSISIGQCRITVSQGRPSRNTNSGGCHLLEHISGSSKGTTVSLDKDIFTIGSAFENDLVIPEALISQKHCEIRIDDMDNCWLMDLGSSNGTKVNKMVLAEGKERMLKDGDVISLVHVDLRFLDKNISHTRSFLGAKVLAGVVTLILMVAGYFVYVNSSPNAYELIVSARRTAKSGAFSQAREQLQNAIHAREFDKFSKEFQHLEDQLSLWELTSSEWNNALQNIKLRRWTSAVRALSMIKFDNVESWGWNEDNAVDAKKQAMNLRHNLELYLLALGKFESTNTQINELKKLRVSLQKGIAEHDKRLDPYAGSLFESMQKLILDIDETVSSFTKLQAVLAKLNLQTPNFRIIVSEMEKLERRRSDIVQALAGKYLIPIRKLEACQRILLNNVIHLANLDFSKIVLKLDLPSMDESSVNPYITQQRRNIVLINRNFGEALTQIRYFHNFLKQWNVVPPEPHPLVTDLASVDVMEKILSCDVLKQRLPNRNRRSAGSVYDEFLGVEYFYEFLKFLPRQYDNFALEYMKFTPKCVRAKRLFEQYENFVKFMALPENRWLVRGEMAKLLNYCRNQLAFRDSFVEACKKTPVGISRASILKRGLGVYFAGEGQISTAYKMQLVQDLKRNRRVLNELEAKYDRALPRDAIEIRENILRRGIPGDSVVRKVWATK